MSTQHNGSAAPPSSEQDLTVGDDKSAEERCESAHTHLQIMETLPSFLWSTNPTGEPTYFNQRILDYSGMRFEDFQHLGWEALIHPDDFPETVKAFEHATKTGTPYEAVHRLRRSDGEYRWHGARGEPLRDREGRIVQWYGLSTDIDDSKKSEERLRRSEAYLAKAQRLSHCGSAAYNETEILYFSEEACRMHAFDPLQGIPSREAAWQRIHPDDVDRVNEAIERGLREKRSFANEFRIILPDGTVKHVEAINDPAFSASGELLEIVATGIDVTERKRAEQTLRESDARFRDYAETASDWFWEIGPDYKFTHLTENAFGSTAAGRIGSTCWDHALDLETEPEKWRCVRAILDSRQPFRDFVYRGLGSNGSPIYVRASGKPVFDANGDFGGYRGTGTDVTALIRAQEEHERLRQLESNLAHTNRLSVMGELAASLAHEIAQPIASARNNACAALHLLGRSADPGQVREALACVVDDADRAGHILDRIRDHIKKTPARKEVVDLNAAILEVTALTHSEAVKTGVTVRTQMAGELPRIQCDRVQLQQVILNLIVNAIQSMSGVEDGNRELHIRTVSIEPEGVCVAVQDTGHGLRPGSLTPLFEPFYTTKADGMGMGLSICRSIVEAHGGRMWATRCEPRGALLQFTIPVDSAAVRD
jgi:PAS domain S-box-containing protein